MNIKITKEKLPAFEREFRMQLKKQFPEIDLQNLKLEYDYKVSLYIGECFEETDNDSIAYIAKWLRG